MKVAGNGLVQDHTGLVQDHTGLVKVIYCKLGFSLPPLRSYTQVWATSFAWLPCCRGLLASRNGRGNYCVPFPLTEHRGGGMPAKVKAHGEASTRGWTIGTATQTIQAREKVSLHINFDTASARNLSWQCISESTVLGELDFRLPFHTLVLAFPAPPVRTLTPSFRHYYTKRWTCYTYQTPPFNARCTHYLRESNSLSD